MLLRMTEGPEQHAHVEHGSLSPTPTAHSGAASDIAMPAHPPSILRRAFRAFACIVGVALLAVGAMFLRDGIAFRSECRIAEGAQVCDTTLDVGAVGRHVAPLKQTAAFTCEQYIRLDPGLRADEDPKTMLEGLHINVSVQDQSGNEVASCELPSPYADVAQGQDAFTEMFTPMAVGEYKVVIDVTAAAPALAGRPVRLVSGYVLCGLEWMGSTFGIAIGSAGAIIGIWICAILWMTRRRTPREFSGASS